MVKKIIIKCAQYHKVESKFNVHCCKYIKILHNLSLNTTVLQYLNHSFAVYSAQ